MYTVSTYNIKCLNTVYVERKTSTRFTWKNKYIHEYIKCLNTVYVEKTTSTRFTWSMIYCTCGTTAQLPKGVILFQLHHLLEISRSLASDNGGRVGRSSHKVGDVDSLRLSKRSSLEGDDVDLLRLSRDSS